MSDLSPERTITAKAGVTIGGAPVSYTAILAALVAVLAFIPASVVVGGMGGGWPFWDVFTPLVGLLLGPIAGPLAAAIGVVVGGVVAPYTNLGPWGFLIGAMAAFTVAMTLLPRRSMWYVPWGITAALNVIYWFQAQAYGIGFGLFTLVGALIAMALLTALRRSNMPKADMAGY